MNKRTVFLFSVIVLCSVLLTGCFCRHEWIEATCREPKTCSLCGKKEGEPVHSWIEATCTTPKTCKLCGVIEGEPAHQYENGFCCLCGKPTPGLETELFELVKEKTCSRWKSYYTISVSISDIPRIIFENTKQQGTKLIANGYAVVNYKGKNYKGDFEATFSMTMDDCSVEKITFQDFFETDQNDQYLRFTFLSGKTYGHVNKELLYIDTTFTFDETNSIQKAYYYQSNRTTQPVLASYELLHAPFDEIYTIVFTATNGYVSIAMYNKDLDGFVWFVWDEDMPFSRMN